MTNQLAETTGRASERTAATLRGIMASRTPKLTGADLARHMGISQQSASRWLNGHHDFKLNQVERIAQWLGVHPEALTPPAHSAEQR